MRFLVFLFAITLSLSALAAEPLIFRDQARDVREKSVLVFLEELDLRKKDAPFSMAAIDLNGDGVDEWIYKEDEMGCEARTDCAFTLIGLSDKRPALLGSMKAGKIAISDEKLYGVRKLLVYNEKNDDFVYQTYVWTPPEMAFTPE